LKSIVLLALLYHKRPSEILDPYDELSGWQRLVLDLYLTAEYFEQEEDDEEKEFKSQVKNEILYR